MTAAHMLKEAEKIVDKETTTYKEKLMDTASLVRSRRKMPKPSGYRILIMMPEIEEKTAGGILKLESTMNTEEVSSIYGIVVDVGPDAYKDESRFPSGPLCEKGDFVVMRAFSGTRLKIEGREFRLLNDDSIEATIDDPRGVTKI